MCISEANDLRLFLSTLPYQHEPKWKFTSVERRFTHQRWHNTDWKPASVPRNTMPVSPTLSMVPLASSGIAPPLQPARYSILVQASSCITDVVPHRNGIIISNFYMRTCLCKATDCQQAFRPSDWPTRQADSHNG